MCRCGHNVGSFEAWMNVGLYAGDRSGLFKVRQTVVRKAITPKQMDAKRHRRRSSKRADFGVAGEGLFGSADIRCGHTSPVRSSADADRPAPCLRTMR